LDQLNSNHGFKFILADGAVETLPALRLKVYVNLSKHIVPGLGRRSMNAAFPPCTLDTGSHLATIPEYIHSCLLPGVVDPLPFDASMPRSMRVISVAGGTFPYWLGRISLKLVDRDGGELDVNLIAQFVEDRGALDHLPLILGLRGGLLEGRMLTAKPDASSPFGQSWILEE
jgi:hypothetical protein